MVRRQKGGKFQSWFSKDVLKGERKQFLWKRKQWQAVTISVYQILIYQQVLQSQVLKLTNTITTDVHVTQSKKSKKAFYDFSYYKKRNCYI